MSFWAYKDCQNFERIEDYQVHTIDLSLIFNENGYIDKNDSDKYQYNKYVTDIILIQSNNSPIKIGDEFLKCYTNLITIDATKLVNIIAIGDYFLCECHKLTNCDIKGFASLVTIGDDFLYYCNKLTNFDTKELTSLVTIGDNFLCLCNLTVFDTTNLTSLTSIGCSFMSGCYKLTHFDMSNLTSLITIGSTFLYRYHEKNIKRIVITIKKRHNYVHEQLLKGNFKIVRLYDKPSICLVNDCVI